MDLSGIPYFGEIAALLAPLTWSLAVILFRVTGRTVSPIPLNIFKNVLALLLFSITAMVFGQGLVRDEPVWVYLLLLASGVIGIGLADMFFFMTLNRLGAGLQAIVNTAYSPSIIFLSVIFLGERLTPIQVMGVVMILGAVLAVTQMRAPEGASVRRTLLVGIVYGLLAAITQAISIVMIKPWLSGWPMMWANSWRMLGGVLAMLLLIGFTRGGWKKLAELRNRKMWAMMIPGSLLGTYVSLIFWLAGMKYTQASTASALNQTSTLFTFVLAALLLHEPVTWKRLLGVLVGSLGVVAVMFGATS